MRRSGESGGVEVGTLAGGVFLPGFEPPEGKASARSTWSAGKPDAHGGTCKSAAGYPFPHPNPYWTTRRRRILSVLCGGCHT
jgi:hypothetical protein